MHRHQTDIKLPLWVLFCLVAGIVQPLQAQFYNGSQISFGKNRVQHQNFNWQYMRAEQYDVYFYPTGKSLAQYTYYKIPEYIREVERLLNYSSRKKIQFIVYNTQQDFRESNFAYDDEDFYNQGGVTNIYGSKIYLYFDGNREHFDRMIRSGIMNVYVHWILQGVTVGSNISSDYLINVPDWVYSGISSYFGQAWNSDIDAHVKDGILTQRYADFDELDPVDATYASHSFWKYIADIYGEEAIGRILYMTRSTKNIERSITIVTGVRYRQLLVNWYKYYYVMYWPDKDRTMPDGDELLKRPKAKRHYYNIALSPDGEHQAYVTNEAGQIRVWLKHADQRKGRCIFRRYTLTEDNPDLSFPLIAWNADGSILGMTLEEEGHCYYHPYNMESGKWEKRFLVDVEKITAWTYSDDGKMMLFSGFKNGQSDIFLYSFLSRSFQNLTNDFYDDYNPIFLNPQQIVFSSNRNRDTISLKDGFMEAQPQPHYDLFLYEYGKKDPALLRVTNTPYADEYQALRIGNQQILYLSDNDGMTNRYDAVFDSTISRIDTAIHYAYFAKTHTLTDYAYGILEHSYNPYTNTIADLFLKDKANRIVLSTLDPTHYITCEPSAFRNKIRWDQVLAQEAPSSGQDGGQDSVQAEKSTKHGFTTISTKVPVVDTLQKSPEEEPFYIPVANGYRVQYSINKLITQADFSFLNTTYQQFEGGTSPIYLNTGFNALFMMGINDLFEDYRITGGVRISVDLESNEFMLSYENLAHRIDRQIVLYRQAITSSSGSSVYKQTSNNLFYILKYPFDKSNSLRLTLNGRYETDVTQALSDNSLQTPDESHVWGGVKLEYVFDSSKELYTNLWRGSKVKLCVEYNQRIEKETKNLLVLGLDARKSFKLYKNMTLALRAAASTNFGSARLVYFMGGVDNWISAKFNSDMWVDENKNYAYQTLATNMRGFQQNSRNGTSFVLFNAELRVPFVQLIAGHQVSYEFLNSLQLNIFGDFGTAWTGLSPYSEDNCLYTRYIESGPISVEVHRQVEPFIGGFGAGLRCKILGYFLRFDYAWGVEDYKITDKSGMFLFSIGTDF